MKKNQEIYKKIKSLRKERGLTLTTLADQIGSDYQQLSRIERGKSKLTVELLMKIADAFETPVGEFMQEKDAGKDDETQPESSQIEQEYLSEILEKLEEASQESGKPMNSQKKANLALLIYKQSLKDRSAIDYGIDLIKTILEK